MLPKISSIGSLVLRQTIDCEVASLIRYRKLNVGHIVKQTSNRGRASVCYPARSSGKSAQYL